MFCIAYVLQFVHKKILQRLKASEVSFCSVSKFDSFPRPSTLQKLLISHWFYVEAGSCF